MPNKRIDELTAGTTPTGGELVPVWQSNQTVSLTLNQVKTLGQPALTNHALLVGTGAAGAPGTIGPDSSTTKVLTANGSGADPSFQTAPGLIGVQIITATGTGTYTPTSDTTSVIIELIGGGGGGGAVASPGGTNVYVATGGQAGGWLRKRLTSGFSGASYSVGAKGTGGAAGANNGNSGSDTTFTTTTAVTYTAKGGAGGTKNGSFAPPIVCGLPTPTITTDGDVAKSGELGSVAVALNVTNTVGGGGANGPYGYGGGAITIGSTNTSSAGAAAGGVGGGGGGAAATGTGVARAGGDGSDGAIIIWEYR